MFSNQHQKNSRTLENQGSRTRRRGGISRGLALLLSFVMAISVIPALKGNVYAHADDTVTMVGSGTVDDPYQISTYAQLKKFAEIVNTGTWQNKEANVYAELVDDITCDDNLWVPIGGWYNAGSYVQHYTGTFDGNRHKIYNLSNAGIDEVTSNNYQGMFGYIGNGGVVKDLGLENGNISGRKYVGSIAGVNCGKIINCYNTGAVTGTGSCTGGVVGQNRALIENSKATLTNCFNTGAISGGSYVGGVVGENSAINDNVKATLTNCFNTGAISGDSHVGGVAGCNRASGGTTITSTITNCYSTGAVTGSGTYIGGVAGYIKGKAKVANCYYNSDNNTGLSAIGENSEESGTVISTSGLSTDQMTGEDAFKTANMVFSYGDNEENPWILRYNDEFGNYYPVLNGVGFEKTTDVTNYMIGLNAVTRKDWPSKIIRNDYNNAYRIFDYADLKDFSDVVNGYNGYTSKPSASAILANDIVCTDKKWVPIGYDGTVNNNLKYTGSFEGNHKKIIGLSNADITDIDSKSYQGLFGFIGLSGKIENLGLENSYIRGCEYVGGIAGENLGEITYCYNVGEVCGQQGSIGGLVGWNNSYNTYGASVTNCYCVGKVTGGSYTGGLVGHNYDTTKMENCYFAGDISAQSQPGGVAGQNNGTIWYCYSVGSTPIGESSSNGEFHVKGLTVKQMTGTTALSTENMVFDYVTGETNPWLVKKDAEYNGKYYWFYPHLNGFDKDASGSQLDPEDITADKWPGKAEISVTWNGADSYEYDKSAHATDVINVISMTDGTENGKEVAETDYTASYSKITTDVNGNPVWTDNINASDIVNVGTYKTVLGFGTGHKAIEKQYSITEKAVTVTPDDVTKVYGTTDPELTYTASGLVDGDTLSGGLTRTAGEAAGEYAITLGTLSNPNYDITLVSGKKLTIATKVLGKDELVLTSNEFTYDGTAKVPGVKVYDGEKEVDPTLYDVEILDNVNAGTATVNVKEKSAANFVGTTTFTINKAEATVTADNKEKAYGDADPGFTYTVTGLCGTDAFGADQITVSRKEGTNVGTYEISVSGEAAIGNYTVKYVPGTLTIVKATPKYSVPAGLTAVVGQKLSEVELPAGWAWADPSGLVGEKGTNTFKAVYTPEDITNYNVVSGVEVSIVVSEPTQNTENGESGNGESGNGEVGNGGSGSISGGSGSTGSGTGNTSGSGAGTKDTTDKDNKDTGKDKDNKDNKDKDTKDNDNKDTTDVVVTQNEDGSETKVIETQNEDGSKTTNTIVTSADGYVTDTKVTVEKNGTVVTEEVEKDVAGNILSSTTETSSVDKKKTVTVVTKTENVDGSSNTSTVSTTKKGTVTITGEIVDADKTKTTFEGKYKKNGAGSSTSVTVDADENVISTRTEKTTVKKGITTTIITTENADGSSVETKTVTDKAGNTEFEETILNADETKTVVTGTINADGTGSNTSITTDAAGNVLSTIEETTTISSKGTVKVTTTTTNVDGTVVTTTTSTYVSGKVKITNTYTDGKGNKTKVSKEIKPTKKGNLKAEVKKTDTTVGKKGSKQTTTVSGNVTFKKNGKITGTLTYTAANGKTQKISVNTTFKKLGMEDMDVTEIIDYLFQNLIVKK